MSFSAKVKDELSRQISPARHCQIAEMAAIISLCGKIEIDEMIIFVLKSIQKMLQLQESTLHY